jgi:Regulator of volume decrease after cellular swelling
MTVPSGTTAPVLSISDHDDGDLERFDDYEEDEEDNECDDNCQVVFRLGRVHDPLPLMRGLDANLEILRAMTKAACDKNGSSTNLTVGECNDEMVLKALHQYLDAEREESVIFPPTWMLSLVTKNSTGELNTLESQADGSSATGVLTVTTERVVFWSMSQNDEDTKNMNQFDLVVSGEAIELHAIQPYGDGETQSTTGESSLKAEQPPCTSVYLQIRDHTDDDGEYESGLAEWTIVPSLNSGHTPENKMARATVESLFKALSKLVALHPVISDESTEHGLFGGGGWVGGDIVSRGGSELLIGGNSELEMTGDVDRSGEDEYYQMLDRLDRMLQVPEHLAVNESADEGSDGGRFDDAESDNELI